MKKGEMWYNGDLRLLTGAMLVTSTRLRHTFTGGVSMDTLSPRPQNDNLYTIYALIDQRNLAVRYIGITNNVYARFAQHLSCDGTNPAKDEWISELKAANVMLIMKTLETTETEEQARERETFWIHHHRFLSAPLLNLAIPSLRMPVKATQRPLPAFRNGSNKSGRKSTYEQIRAIILHRHQYRAYPKGVSDDMCYWYEWMYFTKPKRNEKPFQGQKSATYEAHKRAYDRGRKWIEEYKQSASTTGKEIS